jgi:predicted RNA-binding protein with PUA-like domain
MKRRCWLLKSEPDEFSIDDLERRGRAPWDGIRNHQARNLLRDELRVGDLVLFYHSSVKPPGVAGVARVVREAYPDPSAQDPESPYFDPRATPERPIWVAVDVEFVERFPVFVTLDRLRTSPELADLLVIRRGQRLSVQPVGPAHFDFIRRLGRAGRTEAPRS